MPRYFLADLRTGRQILDLPVRTGPWSNMLNEPETLSVTVDMQDPDVRALGLRNTSAPCKTILAVAEGDTIMASGPIWTRNYNRDSQTVTLNAKGWLSYFDHRHILPLVARTIGVTEFIIPDPTDPTKTMANPALTTAYTGLSLGTIAKRLLQQAQAWTGGAIPLVFPADEAGTHERNYIGAEFKNLGNEIRLLTQVENGPDIKLQGRLTSDRLGIEVLLRTGTQAKPFLASETIYLWDVTVPESPVSNFQITEDGSDIASLAWLTGGRSADEVLVARSDDPTLTGFGYPLFEVLDSSHSSVSKQSTLDAYAAEATLAGRGTSEEWSFDVEPYPTDTDGNPAGQQIGSYQVGDYAKLNVAPYDPTTGAGDAYIVEGGLFRQRIVAMSSDIGKPVHIQCAPGRA